MLRPPIFIKTFGNIEIKIWSYPKEMLKCLLSGIGDNPNAENKILDVVRFRHCYFDEYGGCNCSDKIEDLCFKYSIIVHSRRNIYIPIEIVNSCSNYRHVFIGELSSISEACRKRNRSAINLTSERSGCQCLLRLPTDRTSDVINKCLKSKHGESNNIKECYEKIIKQLIENLSAEICENKYKKNLDKSRILQLCLRNGISSDKIVSLLKELEHGKNCVQKGEEFDDIQEEHSPHSVTSKAHGNTYKLDRSTSPENIELSYEDDGDCKVPSLHKSMHSKDPNTKNTLLSTMYSHKSHNSISNVNEDIKEIKTVLKDIISVINSYDGDDDKEMKNSATFCNSDMFDNHRRIDYEESTPMFCEGSRPSNLDDNVEMCLEENNQMSAEEILNAILHHLSQCKCDAPGQSILKTQNEEPEPYFDIEEKSNFEDRQLRYQNIPTVENNVSQIYRQSAQMIPMIPNIINVNEPPNGSFRSDYIPSSQTCHTDTESQNRAIRHALQMAGIPANLCEYISKLTPLEFHNGITNIYYYVNNETGEITTKSVEKNPISKHTELVTEQYISPKESVCEESSPSGYSHIIVDINFQHGEDQNILCDDEERNTENNSEDQDYGNSLAEPISDQSNSMKQLKMVGSKSNQVGSVKGLTSTTPKYGSSVLNDKSTDKANSMRNHEIRGSESEQIGSTKSDKLPEQTTKSFNVRESTPEPTGSSKHCKFQLPSGSQITFNFGDSVALKKTNLVESIPGQMGSLKNSKTYNLSGSSKNYIIRESFPEQSGFVRTSNHREEKESLINSNMRKCMPEGMRSIRSSKFPGHSNYVTSSNLRVSTPENGVYIRECTSEEERSMRHSKSPGQSGYITSSNLRVSTPEEGGYIRECTAEEERSMRHSKSPGQSGYMTSSNFGVSTSEEGGYIRECTSEEERSMRHSKSPGQSGYMTSSNLRETIPEDARSLRNSRLRQCTPEEEGLVKYFKSFRQSDNTRTSYPREFAPGEANLHTNFLRNSHFREYLPEETGSLKNITSPGQSGFKRTSNLKELVTDESRHSKNSNPQGQIGSLRNSDVRECMPDSVGSMRYSKPVDSADCIRASYLRYCRPEEIRSTANSARTPRTPCSTRNSNLRESSPEDVSPETFKTSAESGNLKERRPVELGSIRSSKSPTNSNIRESTQRQIPSIKNSTVYDVISDQTKFKSSRTMQGEDGSVRFSKNV